MRLRVSGSSEPRSALSGMLTERQRPAGRSSSTAAQGRGIDGRARPVAARGACLTGGEEGLYFGPIEDT